MKISIIGGGPAACFCAVNIKQAREDVDVEIFEASSKLMQKLALTGGGRCNITNNFRTIKNIETAYPRGARLMKRMLKNFDSTALIHWFQAGRIRFKTEEEGKIFPRSNNAFEIVNYLKDKLNQHNINIHYKTKIEDFYPNSTNNNFTIKTKDKEFTSDIVVLASGGFNTLKSLDIINNLELKIEKPVASLFSLNIKDKDFNSLMGISVDNVKLSLAKTKFETNGSLLLTHWGISGPAALKLTSYAARYLQENAYQSELLINWLSTYNQEEIREYFTKIAKDNANKYLRSCPPHELNKKLWEYLLSKLSISEDFRCQDLNKKHINRLVEVLSNDLYNIEGKGRFKDEFVTCGGISLSNINLNTLESKQYPNLYFAGEVLDVDAITGGYNLQAAWSMGFAVAQSIIKKC